MPDRVQSSDSLGAFFGPRGAFLEVFSVMDCARLTIPADAVFLIARQMLAVASSSEKWLTPDERKTAGLKETH
jgi:hypothetical protein